MARANQILLTAHTKGQVRRAAQKVCAGMSRDHRADHDEYRFTDGSSITVTAAKISIQLEHHA